MASKPSTVLPSDSSLRRRPVFRVFLPQDLGQPERLDAAIVLQNPHQGTAGDRAVLERIADEGQLQVILFRELEQLDRVLMAEHRRFIDDDPAAPRRRLHLFIEQEAGDRVRLETVLLQHVRPPWSSWRARSPACPARRIPSSYLASSDDLPAPAGPSTRLTRFSELSSPVTASHCPSLSDLPSASCAGQPLGHADRLRRVPRPPAAWPTM